MATAPDPYSVESYDAAVAGLHDLGSSIERSFRTMFQESDATLHKIEWRVKDKSSADRKILSKSDEYRGYTDLHDLLGMRVITLYESDLDSAAEVIREVIAVDPTRSSDKMDRYQPNEFGYRSVHFVGSLAEERLRLAENRRFFGKVVEVQLRSILQHAWAEIEHDLGYKPKRPISPVIRREFSQLAALVEIGDRMFSDLRSKLNSEIQSAASTVSSSGTSEDKELELTLVSLSAYVLEDPKIRLADEFLATSVSATRLPPGKDFTQFVGHLLDTCVNAGWKTIDDLRATVDASMDELPRYATSLTSQEKSAISQSEYGLRPGFSLIILASRDQREVEET